MQTLNDILVIHRSLKYEEAISAYENWLSLNPTDSKAMELLGIAYGQTNQPKLALQQFKHSLKLDPKSSHVLNHIATCEKRLGNRKTALNTWRKLLSLHPNMPSAYNNLAVMHIEDGIYPKARNALKKALCLFPEYADALFNLGLTGLQTEDPKTSAYLEKSHDLGNKKASYQLALIHEHQGQHEQALTLLNAALDNNNDYAYAHHSKARVLLALGKDEDALGHFIEAQRIKPDIPHLMENIASYFHVKGQYANAIEYWSKVPPQDCEAHEIRYNIGVAYHFMGRHNDAKEHLEAVLAHDPDHINAHLNLAAMYLQASDRDSALRHYEHVLNIEPNKEDVAFIISALKQTQDDINPPTTYVKNLFDQYAHYYENHLTKMLRYQVPDEISLMLAEHVSPGQYAVDLGCGTGIMAKIVKPYCKELTGIDLSANMLAEAAKKDIYDELLEMDCLDYIKSQSKVQLVLAADLFPYLKDPTELVQSIYSALDHNGHFCFSFETSDKENYELNIHARYQHADAWVEKQLTKYGFTILEKRNCTLRSNQNKPVLGTIIMAKKVSA